MALWERLFGRESRRAEQQRAEREDYDARLRAPRSEVVETALGRSVPAVLRELYADEALVTSGDLLVFDPGRTGDGEAAWNINQFTPADEEAIHPELESIPDGAFSFASNEFGDPFYVRLGELPDGDGRVFVHYHDGGDTEEVAPSLRVFLSWPRESRPHRDRAI